MRWISFGRYAVATWAALWLCSANAQQFADPSGAVPAARMRVSPDLAEIVNMVRDRASNDQILERISLMPRLYSVTPQDEENLKALGLPSKYVAAMKKHDKALLKVWKKEAAKAAAAAGGAPVSDTVYTPKVTGGSPVGLAETQMRKEAPLVWLPPPAYTTNQPTVPTTSKQWTSSTIVESAPPPPPLERRPGSPGADYVWDPGHWVWYEAAWRWQPGRWLRRPNPEAQWMNGYWQPHARGFIWVDGEWK